MSTTLLLWVLLAGAPGAFPLPVDKGQVVDPQATVFHVPHQLSRVERFYREAFRGEPKVTFLRSPDGSRVTVRSSRPGDSWARAVLQGAGPTTTLTVTPVLRIDPQKVTGSTPPLVTMVIERSPHVEEQLGEIDAAHAPQH